jgi:xylan 1,4-beta-xylosidase
MVHNAVVRTFSIDCANPSGEFPWWRHALSHGGISPDPLPERVVGGLARLKPKLIRVFLQEFFHPYPEHGVFDWSRLDPFMDSLAATGATVVAAITFKPKPLYPTIDQTIWQPNDVEEWQRLIHALVTRYSVERPIVTHWEVGNETDIGEDGGSPHLIPDAESYAEFYRMTIPPILDAFPEAKVGGPAGCWIDNEPVPGFIKICRETGLRLDFISWHIYNSNPQRHATGIASAYAQVADWPGEPPEFFVTEWARSFPDSLSPDGTAGHHALSIEEAGTEGRSGAATAAVALAMLEAGVDWGFYYHVWDQACDPEAFRPFFSEKGVANMVRHWNEVPHRFGMFSVNGAVRPQYFVFRMLSELGDEQLPVDGSHPGLTLAAASNPGSRAAMVVNHDAGDQVAELRFTGLNPGRKRITITRIDDTHRWDDEALDLVPVEVRDTFTEAAIELQVWSPRDSVTMLQLEDLA